jgi:hypothetical protein
MRYIFLVGLTLLAPTSCADRTPAVASVSGTWFNCENGVIFSAERLDTGLLVTVADGQTFELSEAPTAFGKLFRSGDTVLRIDDDFAVLAGGPVLDHTRCRQMNRAAAGPS